jgi:hypothetical protein
MTLSETKAWLRAKPGRVARDRDGILWRVNQTTGTFEAATKGPQSYWYRAAIGAMRGSEFKKTRVKG